MKRTFLFLIVLLFWGSSPMWASLDTSTVAQLQQQSDIEVDQIDLSETTNDSILSYHLTGPDVRPMRLDERMANGGERIPICSGASPGPGYCSCHVWENRDTGETAPMSSFCAGAGGGSFCETTVNCFGG